MKIYFFFLQKKVLASISNRNEMVVPKRDNERKRERDNK